MLSLNFSSNLINYQDKLESPHLENIPSNRLLKMNMDLNNTSGVNTSALQSVADHPQIELQNLEPDGDDSISRRNLNNSAQSRSSRRTTQKVTLRAASLFIDNTKSQINDAQSVQVRSAARSRANLDQDSDENNSLTNVVIHKSPRKI